MTAIQFSPDGDIISGDIDGYLTIYSKSQDEPESSTWFVSKEFKAHDVSINLSTEIYLIYLTSFIFIFFH